VGHGAPLIRPGLSHQFDFEGELAAIIGLGGRHIPRDEALRHVAGYALFNEGSVRDYQFRSSQWFLGKNFDASGAFGPELATAEELPPGARGLRLTTRVNGELMQEASTADMLFDVATLVSTLSEAMTLSPGDVIVTGTPAGVGMAQTPPRFLQDGDLCEIELEGYGVLRNPSTTNLPPRRGRRNHASGGPKGDALWNPVHFRTPTYVRVPGTGGPGGMIPPGRSRAAPWCGETMPPAAKGRCPWNPVHFRPPTYVRVPGTGGPGGMIPPAGPGQRPGAAKPRLRRPKGTALWNPMHSGLPTYVRVPEQGDRGE